MSRPFDALPPTDAPLPAVVLARDVGEDVAHRHARAGRWTRIGHGLYLPAKVPATTPSVAELRRQSLAHAVGVDRLLTAAHWFSHETAALVWGLPTWRRPRVTHVLQHYSPSARTDRRIQRHTAVGAEDELTTHRGLPVTTLERTAVDCAMSMPALDGLVVADAALRRGADIDMIRELLGRRMCAPGVRRAREVIAHADAGAASPGETATRFVVLRAGLPRPDTQVAVSTRLGERCADLGWPAWRVLLEYDGRSKYADEDELIREKRRHDALVEAGHTVLRVTKEDLARAELVPRVLAALPPDARSRLRPRRWLA